MRPANTEAASSRGIWRGTEPESLGREGSSTMLHAATLFEHVTTNDALPPSTSTSTLDNQPAVGLHSLVDDSRSCLQGRSAYNSVLNCRCGPHCLSPRRFSNPLVALITYSSGISKPRYRRTPAVSSGSSGLDDLNRSTSLQSLSGICRGVMIKTTRVARCGAARRPSQVPTDMMCIRTLYLGKLRPGGVCFLVPTFPSPRWM